MDDEVEACAQRVRHHLRRPLAGSRNLLMNTAGNTVSETVPLASLWRLMIADEERTQPETFANLASAS